MLTLSNLWKKLRNRKYRKAFVSAQLKRGIPFQVRAMRKKLGWSQETLAKEAGITQGVISRAENPNYGNLTFNTVLEIANGFDVAFIGEFVSFGELERRFENQSEESVQVQTFTEENEAFCSSAQTNVSQFSLPSFLAAIEDRLKVQTLGEKYGSETEGESGLGSVNGRIKPKQELAQIRKMPPRAASEGIGRAFEEGAA